MANIKFEVNITVAQLEKITDYLGYKEEIQDPKEESGVMMENPISRNEFLMIKTKDYWKSLYTAQKVNEAQSAIETAKEEGETEMESLSITESK